MAERYSAPVFNADFLEKTYTLRKPEEVLNFLEKHTYLLPVLEEAPAKIHEYFPDAELFLEVFKDIEVPSHQELVVWIGTGLLSKEAVEKLQLLEENWGIHLPNRIIKKFSINLGSR